MNRTRRFLQCPDNVALLSVKYLENSLPNSIMGEVGFGCNNRGIEILENSAQPFILGLAEGLVRIDQPINK